MVYSIEKAIHMNKQAYERIMGRLCKQGAWEPVPQNVLNTPYMYLYSNPQAFGNWGSTTDSPELDQQLDQEHTKYNQDLLNWDLNFRKNNRKNYLEWSKTNPGKTFREYTYTLPESAFTGRPQASQQAGWNIVDNINNQRKYPFIQFRNGQLQWDTSAKQTDPGRWSMFEQDAKELNNSVNKYTRPGETYKDTINRFGGDRIADARATLSSAVDSSLAASDHSRPLVVYGNGYLEPGTTMTNLTGNPVNINDEYQANLTANKSTRLANDAAGRYILNQRVKTLRGTAPDTNTSLGNTIVNNRIQNLGIPENDENRLSIGSPEELAAYNAPITKKDLRQVAATPEEVKNYNKALMERRYGKPTQAAPKPKISWNQYKYMMQRSGQLPTASDYNRRANASETVTYNADPKAPLGSRYSHEMYTAKPKVVAKAAPAKAQTSKAKA